jgi:hypothetical protein
MDRSRDTSGTPGTWAGSWAASALVVTGVVAVLAKIFGVLVAPGLRGTASQKVVEVFELASAAFAYTLTALLIALVCVASFELARTRSIGVVVRSAVVGLSGIVVALASPAVVQRLPTLASVALAIGTGVAALVAGTAAVRSPAARALGALLALLGISALLRVLAWETAAAAADRGSLGLLDVGRGLSTAAIVVQALSTLLAAAWLGTRSRIRGRILANGAIVVAFAITYFAARGSEVPSTAEVVLRASLSEAAGTPAPFAVGSIAAFLVPAAILLALVALSEPREPQPILAALAFALLSHGAFDVPLHALLVTAASGWALLATVDGRAFWAALVARA